MPICTPRLSHTARDRSSDPPTSLGAVEGQATASCSRPHVWATFRLRQVCRNALYTREITDSSIELPACLLDCSDKEGGRPGARPGDWKSLEAGSSGAHCPDLSMGLGCGSKQEFQ